MAAYATVSDVQARLTYTMDTAQSNLCSTLLDDAAVMIDAVAPSASADAKKVVSCRMVIRAMGDGSGSDGGVPLGATQGSMSALGYTQSWTIGAGGGAGELYIGKTDRQLLGLGNAVGSYSPVQELVPDPLPEVPT